MFIDFAELSMMATGAMESLIEGVKAFGRQIEDRLKMENENVISTITIVSLMHY